MKLLMSIILAIAGGSVPGASAIAGATPVTAETYTRPVQIFDVSQGKVVIMLPNTKEIQEEAKSWIMAVESLSGQINAGPKDGIVIRIPLQEPVDINPSISSDRAEELYVFAGPNNGAAVNMLIFTQKSQPLLVNARVNLASFIQKHGLSRYINNAQSNRTM